MAQNKLSFYIHENKDVPTTKVGLTFMDMDVMTMDMIIHNSVNGPVNQQIMMELMQNLLVVLAEED